MLMLPCMHAHSGRSAGSAVLACTRTVVLHAATTHLPLAHRTSAYVDLMPVAGIVATLPTSTY